MTKNSSIYVDNAATTFPKPPEVARALSSIIQSIALSPGRSGHQYSLAAGRIIFQARELLADFFHCQDSSRIIFTSNVTESLNIGIFGLLPNISPGDHIITTRLEHNSVMRPLRNLEKTAGVELSFLPLNKKLELDISSLKRLQRDNTRLIIINHASNVTGAVASLKEIGKQKGQALFMVDAAQSAGIFPIDVEEMNIDFLAFTGHKALYGPTGTGGFYLREGVGLNFLKMGGTGSNSESEEQPEFAPDSYESGTPNTLGIGALAAGLDFIRKTGIDSIRKHEQELCLKFLQGLSQIDEITVYGPEMNSNRAAVVSIKITGLSESEVARILSRDFGIMVRAGLHCTPSTHKALGTFPEGTIRFSFGFFNTEEDVNSCLSALKTICLSNKNKHSL
jgi:cysteine desulfurase / selenocysteine lyase